MARVSHSHSNTDTPSRLLDTAERLIGQQGFDAVSTRAIVRAADVNVAALHYHFGTKRALAQAILERGVRSLLAIRTPALEALLEAPTCTIREIVEAWAQPLLPALAEPSGWVHRYVRFVASLLNAGGAEDIREPADLFEPHLAMFEKLLGRVRPELEPPEADLRLRAMMTTSFRLIATPRSIFDAQGHSGALSEQAYREILLDMLAGMLSAAK